MEYIFSAIKNQDLSLLEQALKDDDVDLNTHFLPSMLTNPSLDDCLYYTPLYLATKMNNLAIIELLLNNGADVKTVVNGDDGLFVSSYDYVILNQNEELTQIFNKYASTNSLLSTRTKKRSENAPLFNFATKKPKSKSARGVLQSF